MKKGLRLWLNTLLIEYKERILSIDLLVCDNRHPEVSIQQALEAIKNAGQDIPVILITDDTSDATLERAFKMYLKADNGGYCPVAVNVKITRFDGGEDALARHFLYRSNLLHKIR